MYHFGIIGDNKQWYDDNGEMKPTKKGISFNPNIAKEVIEGILKTVEESDWKNF